LKPAFGEAADRPDVEVLNIDFDVVFACQRIDVLDKFGAGRLYDVRIAGAEVGVERAPSSIHPRITAISSSVSGFPPSGILG